MENAILLLLSLTVLCALLAAGAWWADRKLEESRPELPPPQKRAIVGETHKPWM